MPVWIPVRIYVDVCTYVCISNHLVTYPETPCGAMAVQLTRARNCQKNDLDMSGKKHSCLESVGRARIGTRVERIPSLRRMSHGTPVPSHNRRVDTNSCVQRERVLVLVLRSELSQDLSHDALASAAGNHVHCTRGESETRCGSEVGSASAPRVPYPPAQVAFCTGHSCAAWFNRFQKPILLKKAFSG